MVFIQFVFGNKSNGCRVALLNLLLFLRVCRRWQADAAVVKVWFLQYSATRKCRLTIISGNEPTVHVTSADTEFNHDRSVRCFGKIECFFHQIDYSW